MEHRDVPTAKSQAGMLGTVEALRDLWPEGHPTYSSFQSLAASLKAKLPTDWQDDDELSSAYEYSHTSTDSAHESTKVQQQEQQSDRDVDADKGEGNEKGVDPQKEQSEVEPNSIGGESDPQAEPRPQGGGKVKPPEHEGEAAKAVGGTDNPPQEKTPVRPPRSKPKGQ